MTSKPKFETIDEYIATFPKDVQGILKKIRQTIKKMAPDAVETISYQTLWQCGVQEGIVALQGSEGLHPVPA